MRKENLRDLRPDADSWIESRRRILRHEADSVAAYPVEGRSSQLQQILALEQHLTAINPARRVPEAQQLKGHG